MENSYLPRFNSEFRELYVCVIVALRIIFCKLLYLFYHCLVYCSNYSLFALCLIVSIGLCVVD